MAVNKKTATYLFFAGALVVIVALGLHFGNARESTGEYSSAAPIEVAGEYPSVESAATPAPEEPVSDPVQEMAVAGEPVETPSANESMDSAEPLPNTDILPVMALGDPNAPVVIEEFSSLTCGHCGNFHTHTLGDLKSEFIDAGLVYYVYHEFPLNGPALDGALLARCMPGDRFWTFTDLLFSTMENWAFSGNHRDHLRQNAKLAGLSDSRINDCLNDEALAEALAKRVEHFAKKYGIQATPTFVINHGEAKLVGNQPVAAFRAAIEAARE